MLSAYLLDRQIVLALLSGNGSRIFLVKLFFKTFSQDLSSVCDALLIFGLCHSLGLETGIDFYTDTPLHLAFIKANTIFWSIAVEFKYYFISPLLMIICHYLFPLEAWPYAIFLFSAIALAIIFRNEFSGTYTATIPYLPVFLVGTIISIFEVLIKKTRRFEALLQ